MLYILTEEEYKVLTVTERSKTKSTIQKLCTMVADNLPVKVYWSDKKEPWTCIHSDHHNEWYCDGCPVAEVCPSTKNWSK